MVLFCQLLKACSVWEDLGDMTTDREYGRPIQRHHSCLHCSTALPSTIKGSWVAASAGGDELICQLQEQSRIQKQQRMLRCWQQACMRQGRLAAGRTGQPPRSGNAGMPTARSLCASLATCRATCQVILDSPPSPQVGVNSPRALAELHATSGLHTEYAGQRFMEGCPKDCVSGNGTAGSALC